MTFRSLAILAMAMLVNGGIASSDIATCSGIYSGSKTELELIVDSHSSPSGNLCEKVNVISSAVNIEDCRFNETTKLLTIHANSKTSDESTFQNWIHLILDTIDVPYDLSNPPKCPVVVQKSHSLRSNGQLSKRTLITPNIALPRDGTMFLASGLVLSVSTWTMIPASIPAPQIDGAVVSALQTLGLSLYQHTSGLEDFVNHGVTTYVRLYPTNFTPAISDLEWATVLTSMYRVLSSGGGGETLTVVFNLGASEAFKLAMSMSRLW
jgi:hypothetical protein